ncbi:MAG TPA: hypothetical protein VNM40_00920 [Candidatus Paceibacterota bacterium]|nr:hypothetical protein [Candidatus Paceibacterota bacterium]
MTDQMEVLLYALIGIFGALSVIVFLWGFVVYLARLGTERRVLGIRIMEWGVALILTAIALIGVLRFFE